MMDTLSYSYTVPYVAHLLVLIILAYVEIRHEGMKKLVMQLTVLSFVVFYGMRGYIGMDLFAYHALFRDLPTLWDWDAEKFWLYKNYEIGFKFYVVVLKSLCNNHDVFLTVNTLIDIALLHVILRRHATVSYAFSAALFLSFMGMVYMVDQIRSCKSLLLFFLSIRYAQNGAFVKYLMLNLCGSLFHVSSLLFVVLYPFFRREWSRRTVWMLFVPGILAFLLRLNVFEALVDFLISCSIPIASNKLAVYMEDALYSSTREISFGFLFSLAGNAVLMYLICWRYYDRLRSDERVRFFVNLFVVYVFFFLFSQWSMITSTRLPGLFIISLVILAPHLLKEMQGVRVKTICFCAFSLYLMTNITIYTTNVEYNYKNRLFQTDGLSHRWNIHVKAEQERHQANPQTEKRND